MKKSLILILSLSLVSCQSAYFSALEKVGYHKRDILVSRVADAREAQGEAKEQFASALEQFTTVLGIEETELSEAYSRLNSAFENSEAKATKVHKRVDQVEKVANALFDEWEDELSVYTNPRLRYDSKKKLDNTVERYQEMLSSMHKAEGKMRPVLQTFREQVLYLKHNLNAQAVSSLQTELVQIEEDVARLIAEMEESIREADSFMQSLQST